MKGYPFNVRVYGVLIENGHILLADEMIRGNHVTKLPGGGLEFGEGTRECLVREFWEETGLRVRTGEHIYTTDYFQPSRLSGEFQVISIYYRVHPIDSFEGLLTADVPFDFPDGQKDDTEVFRWEKLTELNEESFTWPIEKRLVGELKGLKCK